MTYLSYPICAIIVSGIINIIFFFKKRLYSDETKSYKLLILATLIENVFAFLGLISLNFINNNLILDILFKIDYILILLWAYLLFRYFSILSFKNKKINKVMAFVNTIISIIILFCPINIVINNDVVDSNGLSLLILLLMCSFYIISIIVSIIYMVTKKKGKFLNKKYYPFYSLVILVIILIVIKLFIPQVIIQGFAFSITILVMFFTIENPDLKMLEEFHKQRELAKESNSEKISFLFNLSNDIKEPIMNIGRLSSNILLEKDINEIKENTKIIKSSSNELLQLVDNVLDVSDLEKRKIGIRGRQYHVYNLFNTLNKLYEKTLNENIEYRFNYDYSIPEYLYGDSIRLKQIMNILLDNARDYTKEGFVEVNVNHIVKHDICRLIITVEDSGIGIHSEELEHLFDKEKIYSDETLKTIDDAKNNLGMLKSLVNLMNGSVMVNSEYGKGTKFTIVVDQRMKIEKTKVIEAVEKYEELYENKEKVLLVTDEEDIQKEMKKLLKKYDIELEIVEGGQNCLEKIRENKKYDMILIEEDLPKLSSEDTLFKLGELGVYKTPIIVLTVRKEFGVEEELIKKGFNDVIKLPMKKEEAIKIVDKYLKR